MLLPPIRSAAVLGAGVMGAQIAAHLANAGIPAVLLDLTADMAREGLQRARGLKPEPFFTPEAASLIEVGGFDTDLARLAGVDLIVEAVIEQPAIKRALLERVDAVRGSGTIVSSNTSGIPIASLAEGRSEGFRRHWLGTHFFNPPRYLHLLEIIPTPETDPSVVERVSRFADVRLGKGVVIAKDRPNFIANHIGLFSLVQVLKALESGEYTIEEIDAITGPALGRPRSATFRTMDIAGLDVISYVAANLQMSLPPILQSLVDRGWIGEKAGQGFYKRSGSEILVLDPATFTYRPKQPVQLPALEATRNIEDPSERVKALFLDQGKVGRFLRATLGPTLLHTADVASDIAYSIDDIDRAMQWGYGWELGPFEIWDAIGVREVLAAVQTTSDVPPSRRRSSGCSTPARIGSGAAAFRRPARICRFSKRPGIAAVSFAAMPGASLVDLDDGVLAVEFHSKMNTIGGDTVQMLAGRREGSGPEFCRSGRRQRGAEFLGRRQPDARAARGAGGQLGRDRSDGPRIPGCDPGAAVCRRSRRRRASWLDDRRRLRDRPSWRSGAGRRGKLHRPRRGGCRPDSRWWRRQGDARAKR